MSASNAAGWREAAESVQRLLREAESATEAEKKKLLLATVKTATEAWQSFTTETGLNESSECADAMEVAYAAAKAEYLLEHFDHVVEWAVLVWINELNKAAAHQAAVIASYAAFACDSLGLHLGALGWAKNAWNHGIPSAAPELASKVAAIAAIASDAAIETSGPKVASEWPERAWRAGIATAMPTAAWKIADISVKRCYACNQPKLGLMWAERAWRKLDPAVMPECAQRIAVAAASLAAKVDWYQDVLMWAKRAWTKLLAETNPRLAVVAAYRAVSVCVKNSARGSVLAWAYRVWSEPFFADSNPRDAFEAATIAIQELFFARCYAGAERWARRAWQSGFPDASPQAAVSAAYVAAEACLLNDRLLEVLEWGERAWRFRTANFKAATQALRICGLASTRLDSVESARVWAQRLEQQVAITTALKALEIVDAILSECVRLTRYVHIPLWSRIVCLPQLAAHDRSLAVDAAASASQACYELSAYKKSWGWASFAWRMRVTNPSAAVLAASYAAYSSRHLREWPRAVEWAKRACSSQVADANAYYSIRAAAIASEACYKLSAYKKSWGWASFAWRMRVTNPSAAVLAASSAAASSMHLREWPRAVQWAKRACSSQVADANAYYSVRAAAIASRACYELSACKKSWGWARLAWRMRVANPCAAVEAVACAAISSTVLCEWSRAVQWAEYACSREVDNVNTHESANAAAVASMACRLIGQHPKVLAWSELAWSLAFREANPHAAALAAESAAASCMDVQDWTSALDWAKKLWLSSPPESAHFASVQVAVHAAVASLNLGKFVDALQWAELAWSDGEAVANVQAHLFVAAAAASDASVHLRQWHGVLRWAERAWSFEMLAKGWKPASHQTLSLAMFVKNRHLFITAAAHAAVACYALDDRSGMLRWVMRAWTDEFVRENMPAAVLAAKYAAAVCAEMADWKGALAWADRTWEGTFAWSNPGEAIETARIAMKIALTDAATCADGDLVLETAKKWIERSRKLAETSRSEKSFLQCCVVVECCVQLARELELHIAATLRSLAQASATDLIADESNSPQQRAIAGVFALRVAVESCGFADDLVKSVEDRIEQIQNLVQEQSSPEHYDETERVFVETSRSVTETLFKGNRLDELSVALEKLLDVAVWLRCDVDFIIGVAASITAELMHASTADSKGLRATLGWLHTFKETLGDRVQSDARSRVAVLTAVATAHFVAYVHADASGVAKQALEYFDEILRLLAELFPTLEPSQLTMHIGYLIRQAFGMAIELGWKLCSTGELTQEELAGRMLMVQTLNELFLRVRRASSAQIPGLSPESLLESVRALTTDGRVVLAFFDTGTTLLRATFSPSHLRIEEMSRESALLKHEEYDNLLSKIFGPGIAGPLAATGPPDSVNVLPVTSQLANLLLPTDLVWDHLTVFPSSFCHDALTAAVWLAEQAPLPGGCLAQLPWSDAPALACTVEQAPSPGAYLQLLATRMPSRCEPQADPPVVLVVVAGDLEVYSTSVLEKVRRSFEHVNASVLTCSFETEIQVSEDGTIENKLVAKANLGEEPDGPTYPSVHPDVLVWLVHGSFVPGRGAEPVQASSFVLNAQVQDARVRIRPDEIYETGGFWLPVDKRFVRVQLDRTTIVLSGACASGRSGVELGEDAAGLLRAFLAAGIPTVVAPAWPLRVEPASVKAVVVALWERLLQGLVKEGLSVSRAVLEARHAARKKAEESTSQEAPNFLDWGNLAVFGVGRRKLPFGSGGATSRCTLRLEGSPACSHDEKK